MSLDMSSFHFSQEQQQQSFFFDWDFHSNSQHFGVLPDHHQYPHDQFLLGDEEDSSAVCSSEESTGYLQDAVAEWSQRCKRRRLSDPNSSPPSINEDPLTQEVRDLLQGFWGPNCLVDPLSSGVSGDVHMVCTKNKLLCSPTSSQKLQVSNDLIAESSKPSIKISSLKGKKKEYKGLVYPFEIVKPGGTEEDVTLADINARLLMRPTRPVRHPVGKFACLPYFTEDGPGLSGKTVLGLKRIHTRGSGTITIIRTRG